MPQFHLTAHSFSESLDLSMEVGKFLLVKLFQQGLLPTLPFFLSSLFSPLNPRTLSVFSACSAKRPLFAKNGNMVWRGYSDIHMAAQEPDSEIVL